MQFGTVPVATAAGAILAHGVRVGDRLLKKGYRLTLSDIAQLQEAGVSNLMVARLEDGDVPEDQAATRIASACGGDSVRAGAAFTGRVNLYATADGIAVINAELVHALNAIHEAITLATVAPFTRVTKGQLVATIKIIPFAAPVDAVERAECLLSGAGGVIRVSSFQPMKVALISTYLADTKPSLLEKTLTAITDRLKPLGSEVAFEKCVLHSIETLVTAISEAVAAKANPILIMGASAITDRRDIVPAAIELAGGEIERFGMPVDPGNLLLLARKGRTAIIGLPSCARSPKLNGFDYVLWRLLAGLPVAGPELMSMGVGGLLSEIPTRPQPREEPPSESPRLPRIAAIVLAAGLSSRMGFNKLLVPVGGKPLVRHAVEAATASAAEMVIVVTGNGGSEVRRALSPLSPLFVENSEYSIGLSTSLKCGLAHVPSTFDGALVVLGDMPDVRADLLDKLIAAFNPSEGRAICVATRHGKRGNPVLWSRRFFPEILALQGDVGARHLIAQNPELVCEVEAENDAPLTDIDTPPMLADYQTR